MLDDTVEAGGRGIRGVGTGGWSWVFSRNRLRKPSALRLSKDPWALAFLALELGATLGSLPWPPGRASPAHLEMAPGGNQVGCPVSRRPCPGPQERHTRGVPGGGRVVRGPIDEASQGADGVRADQGVAAEGPAVHHADVQGRVQELVLREVLGVGQGL